MASDYVREQAMADERQAEARTILEREMRARAECEDYATELQERLRLERIKIDILLEAVPEITVTGERTVPNAERDPAGSLQWAQEYFAMMEEAKARHASGAQPSNGGNALEGPQHQHFNPVPPEQWAAVPASLGLELHQAGAALGELVDVTLKERAAMAKHFVEAEWLVADLNKAHLAAHDAAFRAALHRPGDVKLHDAAFKHGLEGKPAPGLPQVQKHRKSSAARDEHLAQLSAETAPLPGSPTLPRSPKGGLPGTPSSLQARRIEKELQKSKLGQPAAGGAS